MARKRAEPMRKMFAVQQRTDNLRWYPDGWETIKLFGLCDFADLYVSTRPGLRVANVMREIFD